MLSESFDRNRLSSREGEILDFAIEGMTDVQIAQRLDISQSTVNSYWVRIRGKLGQFSRTEIVALALKQQARTDMAAMTERSKVLELQATEHDRLDDEYRNAEIYHAALDAMPEAVFVCSEQGMIRYTNGRLEKMFGYETNALVGQTILLLFPQRPRDEGRAAIEQYLQAPRPLRLGVDHVVYGKRCDGREFRLIILLDACPTSSGLIVTGVVRDFVSEIGTRRSFMAA